MPVVHCEKLVLMLVIDKRGLVHEAIDTGESVCGQHYGQCTEASADAILTCFACMHPALEKDCGHAEAVIMNCPYANDIHNDDTQRCKCCGECSHECAMDI